MSTEQNPADQPVGDAEMTEAVPMASTGPTVQSPPIPPVPPTPQGAEGAYAPHQATAATTPLGAQAAPSAHTTHAAPTPHTVSGPATVPAPAAQKRPRPRTSPIVWGALILVFCAYVAVRAAGGSIDVTAWLITTILGLGALLLVVGVAVLVRSSGDRR
ncbi:hypothetical protein FB468_1663 [Leucobacter komagatae]|uniref:Uncharacterized protein n=1 Tax=Leucobacter komagatae TaxID=55969 RepID=A0A542Y6I2_9MICO|nr:hypothetical protein [Leucobacter komagatae]TQL43634.1 hypothetical protein FB468_1663 [Leucobacter komagatae]